MHSFDLKKEVMCHPARQDAGVCVRGQSMRKLGKLFCCTNVLSHIRFMSVVMIFQT